MSEALPSSDECLSYARRAQNQLQQLTQDGFFKLFKWRLNLPFIGAVRISHNPRLISKWKICERRMFNMFRRILLQHFKDSSIFILTLWSVPYSFVRLLQMIYVQLCSWICFYSKLAVKFCLFYWSYFIERFRSFV